MEADGGQHFCWEENLRYSGFDPDVAQEKFKDLKYRDRLKDRTVLAKGASLLRVSFLEYSSIKDLLRAFVLEMQNSEVVIKTSNDDLYRRVGFVVSYS